MNALLPFLLLLPVSPPHPAGTGRETTFVEASLELEGELLCWRFVEVEGAGMPELVIAARTEQGDRELRLHRQRAASIEPEPYETISIPPEALGWTFADADPERAGKELVLLTRSGAWVRWPGRADSEPELVQLCATRLLYDVPSSRALDYWEYVIPTAAGGDQLLLPRRGDFQIFGPNGVQGQEPRPWRPLVTLEGGAARAPRDPEDTKRRARDARRRRDRQEKRLATTVQSTLRPFLGSGSDSSLIDDEFSIQSPALVDADGDGLRDLLLLRDDGVHVHLAGADGMPTAPTRVEPFPDYLTRDGRRASLRLVDVDGDARLDVLGLWREDVEAFENAQWRVFVMRSTAERLLPQKPAQVLRFTAAELRVDVTDIDGDGRPDLTVRGFELPSLVGSVTGARFQITQLLYLGGRGGNFDRRPALRQSETFDEGGVQRVFRNQVLAMDCSGDGIADLVDVDLDGQLGVRRLRREESLFGGASWRLEEDHSAKYPSKGGVTSLAVQDVNGDGQGDLISASRSALTVLLSKTQ